MNASYTVMNKVEALVSVAGAIAASAFAIGTVALCFHIASVTANADANLAASNPAITAAKKV